MNQHHQQPNMTCDETRDFIEQCLDDALSNRMEFLVNQHLDACPSCREFHDDMLDIKRALRNLPLVPLPNDTLQVVWSRTIHANPPVRTTRLWNPGLARLATAAAVVLGVLLPWWALERNTADARQRRVEDAVAQTTFVLDVVAGAINRVEHAAVDDVFSDRVSPAVHRVSIDWSEFPLPVIRRQGT